MAHCHSWRLSPESLFQKRPQPDGPTWLFGAKGEHMSIFRSTALVVLSLSIFAGQAPPTKAATESDITGSWSVNMTFPDSGITDMQPSDMHLQQTGSTITGTGISGDPVIGSIDGSSITMTEYLKGIAGATMQIVYKGKLVNGNTMKGTVNFPSYGNGTWTAKRKAG